MSKKVIGVGIFVVLIAILGIFMENTESGQKAMLESAIKKGDIVKIKNILEDNPQFETEDIKKQLAEAEKIAKEEEAKKKAEIERLAKEKAEKAEAERLAKEKAEKEKAEAERLAKKEEVKKKAEAERLAKEEEAKEKAETEKLAKEEAKEVVKMLDWFFVPYAINEDKKCTDYTHITIEGFGIFKNGKLKKCEETDFSMEQNVIFKGAKFNPKSESSRSNFYMAFADEIKKQFKEDINLKKHCSALANVSYTCEYTLNSKLKMYWKAVYDSDEYTLNLFKMK